MSKVTSKRNVYDVKSKIASLEAQNETRRTLDSPERPTTTRISPAKSPALALSNSGSFHRQIEAEEEDDVDDDITVEKQSTTHLASQNRKSRLQRSRQTQPEPGSLMQRRLSAKERRLASLQHHPTLQQQKQAAAAPAQQQQQKPTTTRQENPQQKQQLTAEQTLTSPSSLSHTRSPTRRPVSNNAGQVTSSSNLSQSPSRKSAAEVVRLNSKEPAAILNNDSAESYGEQQQDASNNNRSMMKGGGGGSSSISRFHKLKMKGMDHARLAQKRKEAAQKHHQRSSIKQQEEELPLENESHKNVCPALPDPPVNTHDMQQQQQQQQPSPHHHVQQQQPSPHHHVQQQQPSPHYEQQPSPHRHHQQQQTSPHHLQQQHQTSPHHGVQQQQQTSPPHRYRQLQPPPPPQQLRSPYQQQQPQQQLRSPYQQQQQSPFPITQHSAPVVVKRHDSPVHANTTDDEATLTSVARILDQEQSFSQSRDATASPHRGLRQPPSNSSKAGKPPRLWMGEEKSEKAATLENNNPQGIYPRPSSSSEYEPEIQPRRSHNPYSMRPGAESQTPSPQNTQQQPLHHHHQQQYPPPSSNYHQSSQSPHYASPQGAMMNRMTPHDRVRSGDLIRRSQGSYPSTNGQQFYQSSSNRLEDDDRTFETFDYGVKDDDSQGSTTFQQQLLEADRKAREQSHMSEGNTDYMSQSGDSYSRTSHNDRQPRTSTNTTPKKKPDDPMGNYRQSMESPVMKTACGVVGAATVGCFVIGPVGMLLGAAAVGIGVGVMQIPEEQRNNMAEKAKVTFSKCEEQAYSASEVLSNSCATTYKEYAPEEMSKFCAVSEDDVDPNDGIAPDIKSEDSEAVRLDQVTAAACGAGVGGADLPKLKNQDPRKPASSPNQSRSLRSKKVACLRHVRIIPVSQIHGLEPSAQPRAWLDVLASADTSNDEKTEAMEEILILAKDKQRARIFLEEGILDSIMWILSRYFEKQNRRPTDVWAHPEISIEERNATKLAATCCVSLGKAHCAAIHTEGDLLLMSLYERGTVPEERQLAQMLYEVPHHTRVTKTNDPTIVDPSMEVFALKQLTLPQAEELAKSIKAVADGR